MRHILGKTGIFSEKYSSPYQGKARGSDENPLFATKSLRREEKYLNSFSFYLTLCPCVFSARG